jgi:hypothetical protein
MTATVHHGIDCSPMEYGFIDYNGHAWCAAHVDTYNNYNRHLLSVSGNSPMCYDERDAIADRRHPFFASIANKA